MTPWDLAGEASETAPSVGVTVTDAGAGIAGTGGETGGGTGGGIGAVGSLSAFEVDDSTGAKSPEDEGPCA
jgi:hypothetical protein